MSPKAKETDGQAASVINRFPDTARDEKSEVSCPQCETIYNLITGEITTVMCASCKIKQEEQKEHKYTPIPGGGTGGA